MKLKKITALTMAGSMAALSLTACGGGTSTTATTAAAAAETTAAAADATTAAETSNSDAIVLQVAFENSISEPIGQGIVKAQELLKEKLQLEIDEHEIGYIALHVHAAIVDENVSQAMEIARTVRECISLVEKETGNSIDVMSLGYNRLMNHVRYMVARAIHGEKLKMNLNEYMSVKFPEAFMAAERICRQMEKSLKLPIPDIEIGYLAMHLERMLDTDINE